MALHESTIVEMDLRNVEEAIESAKRDVAHSPSEEALIDACERMHSILRKMAKRVYTD